MSAFSPVDSRMQLHRLVVTSALGVVLAGAMASGCFFGPKLGEFDAAHSPAGIHTRIEAFVGDRPALINGELLAVPDSGLIVLDTTIGVVAIPFYQIRKGTFQDKRPLRIGAGRTPVPSKRRALRRYSRFPQGLDAAMLEALLEAYGQHELRGP